MTSIKLGALWHRKAGVTVIFKDANWSIHSFRRGWLIAAYFSVFSPSAFSFGQLSLGYKTASARYNTVIDSEIKATCARFGVDGGLMALFSGGVSVDYCDYDTDLEDHGLTRMVSDSLELHFTVQVPFPVVSPYAQVGYIPFSSYRATGEVDVDGEMQKGKFTFRGWGPTATLGLSIHPIRFLSAFVQSEWTAERLRKTYVKIGDRDLSSYEGFNSRTQQFLVGIDLSLF